MALSAGKSAPLSSVHATCVPLCVLPISTTLVSDPSCTAVAGSRRIRATEATSGKRAIAASTSDGARNRRA